MTDDMNIQNRERTGSATLNSAPSTEQSSSTHDQTVLVESLAAPDDYWLSITDAARVTRRQEITIRRWIAAGVLPVRGQRMGLNKRTRHVRASDLARLTPIIDPAAAITGAPAQVNLLSIPEQQAQMLVEQQRVVRQIETLTQRAEQSETRVETLHDEVQQTQSNAATAAQTLQETQALTQRLASSVASLTEVVATSQHASADHTQRIASLERIFDDVQAGVTALASRITAVERSTTTLSAQVEKLATLAAQTTRHADQLAAMQHDIAALHTQAASLETRVTNVLRQASDHAGDHEKQHDAQTQAMQQLRAEIARAVRQTDDLRAQHAHHTQTQATIEQHTHMTEQRIAELHQAQEQLQHELLHTLRLMRIRSRLSKSRTLRLPRRDAPNQA